MGQTLTCRWPASPPRAHRRILPCLKEARPCCRQSLSPQGRGGRRCSSQHVMLSICKLCGQYGSLMGVKAVAVRVLRTDSQGCAISGARGLGLGAATEKVDHQTDRRPAHMSSCVDQSRSSLIAVMSHAGAQCQLAPLAAAGYGVAMWSASAWPISV